METYIKPDLELINESAESCLALKPDGFDGKKDGYDKALIGLTEGGQLVYCKEMMVEILMDVSQKQGDIMTEEDAWEYLEFNCFCAYVGEQTPIFVNTYQNIK